MDSFIEKGFYFLSVLILLPLWVLIYYTRKDLQKKLIRTGVIFGIASVILGQFFTQDYWNPPYLIHPRFPLEDFLYGIFFGGLTTVIYQYVFRLKFLTKTTSSSRKMTLILGGICIVVMLLFVNILDINSIYGQVVCLLLVSLYIVFKRKDLMLHMLFSGITVTIFTFIWQQIVLLLYPSAVDNFWVMDSLLNIFYWGVPFEELLFAFTLGLGGALYFECSRGFKIS